LSALGEAGKAAAQGGPALSQRQVKNPLVILPGEVQFAVVRRHRAPHMLAESLILLFAICSLAEIRRRERQITARFIERGKQKIPESHETAKEDEMSLHGALHGSKVGFWVIIAFSAIDLIHRLFTHE